MSQYIQLELHTLVDELVENIKEYDRMLTSKVFTEEEFTQCKQKLAEIHAAIKQKGEEAGSPMNNIFPSFPTDYPAKVSE